MDGAPTCWRLGAMARSSIVEIKSSVADFRADRKWPEYRRGCDRFYFAVPEGFPHELIPEECGLIEADGFGAAILREGRDEKLVGRAGAPFICALPRSPPAGCTACSIPAQAIPIRRFERGVNAQRATRAIVAVVLKPGSSSASRTLPP